MIWKRFAIGLGISLAVIAPLVVAVFLATFIPVFVEFFEREDWDGKAMPGLTGFVIDSQSLFRGGLIFVALVSAGLWFYVARRHRARLLISTAAITICSLHLCLLVMLTTSAAMLLPFVQRSLL